MDVSPGAQSSFDTSLYDATHEDAYLESKQSIIQYFKDTYGDTWRSAYAQERLLSEGKADTARNRNTALRDVQGKREFSEAKFKSTKELYKKLGKRLPPVKVPKKLQGKKATVTVDVYFDISGTTGNHRTFTRTLSAAGTHEMLEGKIDPLFAAYGINPGDIEVVGDINVKVSFD